MNVDILFKALRKDPPAKVQEQHVQQMKLRAEEFIRQKIEAGNLRLEHSAPFDKAFAEFLNKNGISKQISPRKLDPKAVKRRHSELAEPNPPRLSKHIIRHGSVWLVLTPPYSGWATNPAQPEGSSANDATGSARVTAGGAGFSITAGEGVSGSGLSNNGPGAVGVFTDLGNYFSPPTGICGVQEAQLTIEANPVVNWNGDWHSAMQAPATLEFGLYLVVNQWDQNWNFVGTPLVTAGQYRINDTYKYLDNWSGPLGEFNLTLPLNGSVAVTAQQNYAVWVEMFAFAQAQGSGSWGSDSSADLGGNFTLPAIDLYLNYNA